MPSLLPQREVDLTIHLRKSTSPEVTCSLKANMQLCHRTQQRFCPNTGSCLGFAVFSASFALATRANSVVWRSSHHDGRINLCFKPGSCLTVGGVQRSERPALALLPFTACGVRIVSSHTAKHVHFYDIGVYVDVWSTLNLLVHKENEQVITLQLL